MGHQALVMEVVQQLSRMFKPDFKQIKKRIEDLIERDFLERDKENPQMFKQGLRKAWRAPVILDEQRVQRLAENAVLARMPSLCSLLMPYVQLKQTDSSSTGGSHHQQQQREILNALHPINPFVALPSVPHQAATRGRCRCSCCGDILAYAAGNCAFANQFLPGALIADATGWQADGLLEALRRKQACMTSQACLVATRPQDVTAFKKQLA
eukprot:365303-Chlamydomonas_euryale.AAC.32